MNYFSMIISLLISSTFIASFYMKAKSFPSTKCEIYSYKIIKNRQLINISSYFLLITELLIAICFAFNLFGSIKIVFCGLLLIFFCLILLNKRKKEKDIKASSCSCFGDMEFMNKYPLFRNCILLGLLLIQLFLPTYQLDFKLEVTLFLLIVIVIIFYDLILQIKKLKANYI
ncbi:preprotein translocase subunit YajC [Lysinibacillus parviboronicapiens]|uniref:Preprotein translocase subunit YajC n=2 Tax=Lysinibacillus parviboronicapiens TaxID=436516 RepID=A0ABV2PJU3_9BACI